MVELIGWMICPECGEVDYRPIVPTGIGGSDSICLYMFCAKDDDGR